MAYVWDPHTQEAGAVRPVSSSPDNRRQWHARLSTLEMERYQEKLEEEWRDRLQPWIKGLGVIKMSIYPEIDLRI